MKTDEATIRLQDNMLKRLVLLNVNLKAMNPTTLLLASKRFDDPDNVGSSDQDRMMVLSELRPPLVTVTIRSFITTEKGPR
jgi:hypothetical protein